MPKIKVKPRASSAYCAPRLSPMIAACRNSDIARLSFRPGFLALDAKVLAVLDDADAEREEQGLRDAEIGLSGPVTFADIGVLHRHGAQDRGDVPCIVGAGGLHRLDGHAGAGEVGPEGGAADRVVAHQLA